MSRVNKSVRFYLLVCQWNSNLYIQWFSNSRQNREFINYNVWTTVDLLNFEDLFDSSDIHSGWCELTVDYISLPPLCSSVYHLFFFFRFVFVLTETGINSFSERFYYYTEYKK